MRSTTNYYVVRSENRGIIEQKKKRFDTMKEEGSMDERVWEKTAQFLKELRCEDTGRLSQLQLPEYQKAMKEKFSYQPIYEQTVCEMTDEQKCVIEKYVGLTEQCAEEENQQAYLQGMVDMLLFTIRKRNIESSLRYAGKN